MTKVRPGIKEVEERQQLIGVTLAPVMTMIKHFVGKQHHDNIQSITVLTDVTKATS